MFNHSFLWPAIADWRWAFSGTGLFSLTQMNILFWHKTGIIHFISLATANGWLLDSALLAVCVSAWQLHHGIPSTIKCATHNAASRLLHFWRCLLSACAGYTSVPPGGFLFSNFRTQTSGVEVKIIHSLQDGTSNKHVEDSRKETLPVTHMHSQVVQCAFKYGQC